MINRFLNDDRGYEKYLSLGQAYVCNGIGMGTRWHRIHRSDCNSLNRGGQAKDGLRTSVGKICSRDLQSLVATITREFGVEGSGFSYCDFCSRADRV